MKKYLSFFALFLLVTGSYAQKKDFSYKFYGQIRTDLYYNSRSNAETVDGLFYMYPKDKVLDPDGNDLNDVANSNFYTLYTRLGVDVAGPMLGEIKTSAKVEVDFRGSGTTFSTVRLRHAYLNLAWKESALLMGQTWHPLYGDVAPDILNLNMGAPYQPFSRAPQIRYRLNAKAFQLTAAAVWQSQYLSVGPGDVKSQEYLKKSCVPELYVGLDYKNKGFLAGAGVEMLSMVPRTEATGSDGKLYKVDERITTLSYEVHAKYKTEKLYLSAKSLLSSNLTQTSTVGGYGIKSIDSRTGEQEYAPLRTSHSWINAVYGTKWRGGIFAGYLKNLGASDEVSNLFGTGTNLDELMTGSLELTYNVPNWKFGVEYSLCAAQYGTNDKKGKVFDTHSVTNNRVVFTALFQF